MANERTDPKIKQWLDLISDSLDYKVKPSKHITAMLQKVIREIQEDTISPKENAQLKDEWEWRETKRIAREVGIQKDRLDIIKNMIKAGLDHATIAKLTGLSLDTITEILEQEDDILEAMQE